MIYSVDGKIISVDGRFFERRVKSLTYQVKGSWFPQSYYNGVNNTNIKNGNEYLQFVSTTPNSLVINYGDGTVVTKNFGLVASGVYVAGYTFRPTDEGVSWAIPQHTYSDGFTGIRNITFEFQNPDGLRDINFQFMRLTGSLPTETTFFKKLKALNVFYARDLDLIPNSFPKELTSYGISFSLKVKETVFSEALFETKLSTLSISDSYDLSDNLSSNFFKINQLKDTLSQCYIENCDIISLPNEIEECTRLSDLRMGYNKFTTIPFQVNSLINLNRLYVGSSALTNTSMPIWSGLQKLQYLSLSFPQSNLNDIPNSWKYLFSLISLQSLNLLINNNTRFNLFIDNFYELCTVNGSVTAGGSPAPYPNRFRNISWGASSLSFSGAKVAPSGYIQGISNGTPTTQGQKAYVLQNQYNHTITHGTPL